MLKHLCVGTTLMLSAPLAVRMAGAQSPQRAQVGAVSGLIFDSLLTNAPLAGAEVTIDGRETTAITDARGAFSLSGVPAGAVTLRFYHHALDSLGIGAPPVSLVVPDSGIAQVRLSTPSPARFRAMMCPGPQAASTGAVFGIARNADDRAPLAHPSSQRPGPNGPPSPPD